MLKQMAFTGVSEHIVNDCVICGFGSLAKGVAENVVNSL